MRKAKRSEKLLDRSRSSGLRQIGRLQYRAKFGTSAHWPKAPAGKFADLGALAAATAGKVRYFATLDVQGDADSFLVRDRQHPTAGEEW